MTQPARPDALLRALEADIRSEYWATEYEIPSRKRLLEFADRLAAVLDCPAPEPAPPGFLKVEITYGGHRHLVIAHADMGHVPAIVDRIDEAVMALIGFAEAPHA